MNKIQVTIYDIQQNTLIKIATWELEPEAFSNYMISNSITGKLSQSSYITIWASDDAIRVRLWRKYNDSISC